MGTHQELEMFGSQPAYPEKLLHKKESLQNQLINIRVELSQASTVIENLPVSQAFLPAFSHKGTCRDRRPLLGRVGKGHISTIGSYDLCRIDPSNHPLPCLAVSNKQVFKGNREHSSASEAMTEPREHGPPFGQSMGFAPLYSVLLQQHELHLCSITLPAEPASAACNSCFANMGTACVKGELV